MQIEEILKFKVQLKNHAKETEKIEEKTNILLHLGGQCKQLCFEKKKCKPKFIDINIVTTLAMKEVWYCSCRKKATSRKT